MNSFFSTLVDGLLQELLMSLDTLDDLHTCSIEYTFKRDKGSVIGLEVNILILLAEQKETSLTRIPQKDVKTVAEDLRKPL